MRGLIDWTALFRIWFLDWWWKADERTRLDHLRDLGVR